MQFVTIFYIILNSGIIVHLSSIIMTIKNNYKKIESDLPPPNIYRIKPFFNYLMQYNISGKFSVKSPRGVHHPDSDLSITHYIGLFSPRKKLVKAKKLYSQNFSKYAPLKSDRVFSSFVIIQI